MNSSNPLSAYFRQPSIYLKMPSNGEFYPEGTITISPSGEVPVMPMTARDEITYRTPDALLNGSAVVEVIQSCIPSIKNAWYMPTTDLDAALIAIRIASYGHAMDFETKCTSCGEDSTRTVDLRSVLSEIRSPDYSRTLVAGDLEFYFRPMSYHEMNENNKLQWQHQKSMQVVNDSELDEDRKIKMISDNLRSLSDVTTAAIASSIGAIKTPGSIVTEKEHILEFLTNCDRELFIRIQNHLVDIRQHSSIKPVEINCSSCDNVYKQELTLDMSHFFASAS